MRDSIGAAQAETDAHEVAVQAAASLEAARAESARHEDAMLGLMEEMDDTLAGMIGHCSGLGLADLARTRALISDEVDDHLTTMAAAADLNAAKAETGRHADAMRGMMDGMTGAMEQVGCRGPFPSW